MKEIETKSTGRSRDRGKRKVRKNGVLRFQLALIIAMLMVYGGLEATFGYWQPQDYKEVPPIDEVTMVDVPNLPPERRPQAERVQRNSRRLTPEIEVIPDDDPEVIAKVIEKICDDCTDTADPPDGIDYVDPNAGVETVPINDGRLEELPIFPGCEGVPNDERFACFNKRMQRHVRRVFRYPEKDLAQGNGGKVYVQFRINEFGEIDNIQYRGRGTTESLDAEAYRIISKLPNMTPAKMAGKPVRVTYSIPIIFEQQ